LKYLKVDGANVTMGLVEKMMGDEELGGRLEKICLIGDELYMSDFQEKIKELSGRRKRLVVEVGDKVSSVSSWLGGKEKLIQGGSGDV